MSEEKKQDVKLEKNIDLFGTTSILFNIIIGSGIFYLGSLVLMYAGFSQGLAMLAWVLGGIVSMLGGLHFAELGTSIKKQGSHPVFLSEAYHPIAGYIYNITTIFISSPAATATFGLAFVGVFGPSLGLSPAMTKIAAIAFLGMIVLLNIAGSKVALLINKVRSSSNLLRCSSSSSRASWPARSHRTCPSWPRAARVVWQRFRCCCSARTPQCGPSLAGS